MLSQRLCRAERHLADRDLHLAEKDKTIDALKARVSRLQKAARKGEQRRTSAAGNDPGEDLDILCRRSAELLEQVSGFVAEGEMRAGLAAVDGRPQRRSPSARRTAAPARAPAEEEDVDSPRLLSWAAVRDAVAEKDAAERVSRPIRSALTVA